MSLEISEAQQTSAYKGHLLPLLSNNEETVAKLRTEFVNLPKIDLTSRQICDLELLLNGGFSPLKGFLNEEDYKG